MRTLAAWGRAGALGLALAFAVAAAVPHRALASSKHAEDKAPVLA